MCKKAKWLFNIVNRFNSIRWEAVLALTCWQGLVFLSYINQMLILPAGVKILSCSAWEPVQLHILYLAAAQMLLILSHYFLTGGCNLRNGSVPLWLSCSLGIELPIFLLEDFLLKWTLLSTQWKCLLNKKTKKKCRKVQNTVNILKDNLKIQLLRHKLYMHVTLYLLFIVFYFSVKHFMLLDLYESCSKNIVVLWENWQSWLNHTNPCKMFHTNLMFYLYLSVIFQYFLIGQIEMCAMIR